MNHKILQYLMGNSDILVTMNVYTHIGLDDAEKELIRMEEFRRVQEYVEKMNDVWGIAKSGVTLNTYTHFGLEDATDELKRMEELENARKELEKNKEEKPVSQKMFRAIEYGKSTPCFGRAFFDLK